MPDLLFVNTFISLLSGTCVMNTKTEQTAGDGSRGKQKYLVIFDFDNTLISKNTDQEIIRTQSLVGKCVSAKNWFTNTVGWAESMSFTLKELHENNFSKQDIDNIIKTIPLLDGMLNAINVLKDKKDNVELVMVSHSNSYFIDILLREFNMGSLFDIIYTYQSEWINEQLFIKPYDVPHTMCELCPIDFCKGVCVETHKERMDWRKDESYKSIVYVGDGTADFCAALTLSKDDYVLARSDYSLHNRILKDNGKNLKANHVVWKNGHDVADFFDKLFM